VDLSGISPTAGSEGRPDVGYGAQKSADLPFSVAVPRTEEDQIETEKTIGEKEEREAETEDGDASGSPPARQLAASVSGAISALLNLF